MVEFTEARTYLLTWTCYGTWLHGDRRQSVDREHNIPNTPRLAPHAAKEAAASRRLRHPPYKLNDRAREVTLHAIAEVCRYRQWKLWAAHVRSKHVHVVVTAAEAPERVMKDLKAYASRALTRGAVDDCPGRRWTRHGSTRYINAQLSLDAAIDYVLNQQGEPMIWWSYENESSGG
ncbi:MAG: transposase [Phycisphaerales bacterium]|nr:MAG: transposase [Phycisphaerales bacterium]